MASEEHMMEQDESINVEGGTLGLCGTDPVTGYYRDGHCNTCAADEGSHTVCAIIIYWVGFESAETKNGKVLG